LFAINLLPNYCEYINPQPFFAKTASMSEASREFRTYYLERDASVFKASNIYAQGNFADPRDPITLSIRATVVFNPEVPEYAAPALALDFDGLLLFRRDSAVSNELDSFDDMDRQILVPAAVTDIVKDGYVQMLGSSVIARGIMAVKLEIISASHHGEMVRLFTRPDGLGYIAQTTRDTGRVSGVTNGLYKCLNGRIYMGYAIKFKDREPIVLDYPREDDSLQNWFLKVRCGYFTIKAPLGNSGNYERRHYYLSVLRQPLHIGHEGQDGAREAAGQLAP
jgi:hypothetical protein